MAVVKHIALVRSIFSISSFLLLSSACSIAQFSTEQTEEIDLYRGHYIVIHTEGRPADRFGRKISMSKFENDYVKKIKKGIQQYLNYSQAGKEKKEPGRILFFIHGGLNTLNDNFKRMRNLVEFKGEGQEKYGVIQGSSFYPVFINWEASYLTALWDDIFVIRQGQRPQGFWEWAASISTSPFVLATRLAESVVSAPRGLYYMGENFGKTFHDQDVGEIAANMAINVPLFPVRFLTVPLIDAFGSPAWEMLKRRTDLMITRTKGKEGALAIFMKQLICSESETAAGCIKYKNEKTFWVADDSESEREIELTLMGHSMGTLVIDRLIWAFPKVPFKRIVYLASASSFEDVEVSVLPYVRVHGHTDFYAFSLSEGDEARETQRYCVGEAEEVCLPRYLDPLERGSLLVWIDSFLQRVYKERQLRFGRIRNHKLIEHKPFAEEYIKAIIEVPGKEGDPTVHGDFDKQIYVKRILCTVDRDSIPGDCKPYKNLEPATQ